MAATEDMITCCIQEKKKAVVKDVRVAEVIWITEVCAMPYEWQEDRRMEMNFQELYGSVLKEYPDVLTVEEMSRALGICTKTAYRLVRSNQVRHLRLGRAYRIPKTHLVTYLQQTYDKLDFC